MLYDHNRGLRQTIMHRWFVITCHIAVQTAWSLLQHAVALYPQLMLVSYIPCKSMPCLYNNRESIRMHLGCAFIFFLFCQCSPAHGRQPHSLSWTHCPLRNAYTALITLTLLVKFYRECRWYKIVEYIEIYLSGRKEYFYMPKNVIYVHNFVFCWFWHSKLQN